MHKSCFASVFVYECVSLSLLNATITRCFCNWSLEWRCLIALHGVAFHVLAQVYRNVFCDWWPNIAFDCCILYDSRAAALRAKHKMWPGVSVFSIPYILRWSSGWAVGNWIVHFHVLFKTLSFRSLDLSFSFLDFRRLFIKVPAIQPELARRACQLFWNEFPGLHEVSTSPRIQSFVADLFA